MFSEMTEEKMLARALRLAKKYNLFVRFYPEGTEGADNKDDVLDNAIKESEKASKTPEEQSAIDKARANEQQLEQERANAQRANKAAKQAEEELASAQSEIADLRQQLDEVKTKAEEAGITDIELKEEEYDETERKLVKAIKTIEKKIAVKDKRIATLEEKARTYEQTTRDRDAQAARNSNYEALLTDLDSEYGADCRNGAIQRFNELVTAGKVPKGNAAKATRIMESCYKQEKAARDKAKADKKSSSLPLDKGSGGGTGPNLKGVEIKSGSLDEVAGQFGAALKDYKPTGD